jgi:hypothetical protein
MPFDELIHIAVPAPDYDPRGPRPRNPAEDLPGVRVHYVPAIDPADLTTIDGMRVTTVPRTIIDCAEVADARELLSMFQTAWERGLLDLDEYHASRARVEWRPSLEMLDRVFDLFCHSIS